MLRGQNNINRITKMTGIIAIDVSMITCLVSGRMGILYNTREQGTTNKRPRSTHVCMNVNT